MSLGIRAMSTRAEGPAVIVRRAVDGLGPADSADYQEAVADRADELADWLRADKARSRSFAEELRPSASRLEEAIIQWGPTLIEDPESAALLNLLPDIVDSARSATDTIAPAAGWTTAPGGPANVSAPSGSAQTATGSSSRTACSTS